VLEEFEKPDLRAIRNQEPTTLSKITRLIRALQDVRNLMNYDDVDEVFREDNRMANLKSDYDRWTQRDMEGYADFLAEVDDWAVDAEEFMERYLVWEIEQEKEKRLGASPSPEVEFEDEPEPEAEPKQNGSEARSRHSF
jgi:hypothetical protein